jgi:hypothetical protein
MKPQIVKLSAHLLKKLSDTMANNVCNDLDSDVLEMLACWTDEQREKFMKDADEWNHGSVELERIEQMPDWMIAEVISYQLTKYF